MRRILGIVAVILFVLCGQRANAQLWSGVLDPSRGIDWTQAGASIPTRTTVCATPTMFGGSGNAGGNGLAIRSAILGCSANQVVLLPAGTWYVDYLQFGSGGSPVSNVTLRGAGPNATFIIITNGSGCTGLGAAICLVNADNNYSGNPSNAGSWVGGYSKGTTSITLGGFSQGSIGNLHVGSLLILDQQDDSSDTGNVFICQTAGFDGACSQQGGVGNGRPGRAQTQTVKVTSISGSTIGITPGLYASNWTSAKSPGFWFSGALPISGDGIENLSVDYTALTGEGVGIMMTNAYGNWVSNFRGINSSRSSHIQMYQSAHNTVHNSYFYGSNGTSSSYGIDTGYASSDNRIENNICQHISTCEITEGDSGSVFDYNYAVDDYFQSINWQQEDSYHHSVADCFTLREGNIGIGLFGDDIHGTSCLITAFRNYWNGRDTVGPPFGPKTQQTNPVQLQTFSRLINFIGNAVGTQGYHTIYQTVAPNSTDCGNAGNSNVSIYVLGYSGNQGLAFNCSGGGFFIPNDLNVAATMYRWANVDPVNSWVQQFNSSEVPSGLPAYAQPVPSSHTIPPSFLFSSQPDFWGGQVWPPIHPESGGGGVSNVGGHVDLNPAADCFLNYMHGATDGSSGLLAFDANTCPYYSGGSNPLVSFSPSPLAFGTVTIGSTPTLTTTLQNVGSATLSITSISSTDTADFPINSTTCGSTLAASATCTITIKFQPTVATTYSASISMVDNASGSPHTVPLTGKGQASAVPVPTAPTISIMVSP